jgi:hypothetical protein
MPRAPARCRARGRDAVVPWPRAVGSRQGGVRESLRVVSRAGRQRGRTGSSNRPPGTRSAVARRRAVHSDILPFLRELSSRRPPSHVEGPPTSRQGLCGVNELPDDHPHDDFAAPAAALRPPAAGSRPQHGGGDHRHGPRGSSIDGPWLAPQGTEGRGNHGRTNVKTLELQHEVLELRSDELARSDLR